MLSTYDAPRVVINIYKQNILQMYFNYKCTLIYHKKSYKHLHIDNSRVVMYFNYKQIQNKYKVRSCIWELKYNLSSSLQIL